MHVFIISIRLKRNQYHLICILFEIRQIGTHCVCRCSSYNNISDYRYGNIGDDGVARYAPWIIRWFGLHIIFDLDLLLLLLIIASTFPSLLLLVSSSFISAPRFVSSLPSLATFISIHGLCFLFNLIALNRIRLQVRKYYFFIGYTITRRHGVNK